MPCGGVGVTCGAGVTSESGVCVACAGAGGVTSAAASAAARRPAASCPM